MTNINKKISIMFLMVFIILSTAFAYISNATEYTGSYGDENNGLIYYEREEHIIGEYSNEYGEFIYEELPTSMRGWLIIQSIHVHSYNSGDYISLKEMREYYDVLCNQKGTKLPSDANTYLVGSNGDILSYSFPHLTMNDLGMELYKEDNRKTAFPSPTYKSFSLGYYKPGELHIATPKEAYILAEMVKELETTVLYYDIDVDENGNKIKYEGSLEGAESITIGDEVIYIVDKQYVAELPDGETVVVEQVGDGNGGIAYKYYRNQYIEYEGSLTWTESKTGGGGTYPNYRYENSSSGEGFIPSGSNIYITGSRIVVKEGDEYYRATIETNNSYIQLAWWTTIAGGTGNYVPDTAFSQEADAFEAYILQAAGVLSTDELEHTTETVIDEEGNEIEVENAFKFDYPASWITTEEYDTPTTIFEENTQTYLVGPFAMDYIEASAQFGGRPEVKFAGITGMELYTDAQEEPLVFGEDWELVYLDGERSDSEDAPIYPKSNEKFYIRLINAEDATKIVNIKATFKYMNAAGSWQSLHGTYFKATWDQKSKVHKKWVYDRDENGELQYNEDGSIKLKEVYDYTQYWLKLTDIQEFDSQYLGLGIKGAKWYKEVSIDRATTIKEDKIIIEKKVVDENGEPLKDIDPDAQFKFNIYVDGALNSTDKPETVYVKAGESVESKIYYWNSETNPTFRVEEVLDENTKYEVVGIENANGTLTGIDTDNATKVIATNKLIEKHEGYLEIIKIMEKTGIDLDADDFTFVGQEFVFDVTLSGTFEYQGIKYVDDSVNMQLRVVAAEDEETAVATATDMVYWYGDVAPAYTVSEVATPGTTQVSMNPQTGVLVDKNVDSETNVTRIVVTAVNRHKTEHGSIRIIKVLEGSSGLPTEYIESLEFTFKISVDKYEPEIITLKTPTRQNENGDWVWEGTSSEYVWLYGNNPNYSIEEINVPEGTVFDEGRSQVEGTLVSDETQNYEVKNEIINKSEVTPNTGKLEITKKVEEANLVDKDYMFRVIVKDADFKYTAPDGTVFECLDGEFLQLTNDSAIKFAKGADYSDEDFVVIKAAATGTGAGEGTWLSGEFSWYGNNAPKYTVDEKLLGENIASSVEPSKGTLEDTETDTVEITAWNRNIPNPKAGYLHIIKTLENAEKYSLEYVNSLIFKFKIEVEGYEEAIVSLSPRRENDKWIWEYTSDKYSWDENEEPLDYKITEIDLPEGTDFVSAEGPEGSTVDNGNKCINGKLKESISSDVLVTTDNSFINKLVEEKEHKDELIIKKDITHEALAGIEFKFDVTIKGSCDISYIDEFGNSINEAIENSEKTIKIKANGGQQSEPIKVTWRGDVAPTYSVAECKSDVAKQVSIQNGAGSFTCEECQGKTEEPTFTTVTNEPILIGGYVSITKKVSEGPQDQPFYFSVKVGNNEPYVVAVKPGDTYKSDMYKWYKSETAPICVVEEIDIPEGAKFVETTIKFPDGTTKVENSQRVEFSLVENATVEVNVLNEYTQKQAKFDVKKVVLDEKLIDAAANQEFKMRVRIQGYYKVEGNEGYHEDSVIEIALKGGQTFTSPTITWWGENAPTVTVEEYDLPLGWELVGISNNGATILEDNSLEIIVTNKLPVYVTLDLTTKLAGEVWEDEAQDKTGKNTPESVPNGFIDYKEGSDGKLIQVEAAVSGVEVYIYKVVRDVNGNEVSREMTTVYKDINNTELTLPIVTGADGTWEAPRVKIPTVTDEEKQAGYTASYDVEFIYDGQTYEPTKFLATSNGDAAAYINAKTAEKDKYANDSMALDYDRDVVNNRIQTITGKTPIDGLGNTIGTAQGNEGENNLYYEAKDIELIDEETTTKLVSTLKTLKEDGTAQDLFKTKARTSIGGLTYPFAHDTENWNGFHLYNESTTITELGVEQKYWYEAVYNYCLHINLGLVKRPDADMGLVKDLYSAKVGVKGDSETIEYNSFRFNTLADINADYYTRQVEDFTRVSYTLGLYSTDYYYRAEMYQTDVNLYTKLEEFYKDIGGLDATEMDVELTYKIVVYNESGSYIEQIKAINDYYDSSFGMPESIRLNALDGEEISSYYVSEKEIKGSDGVTYNKLEINGLDIKLASGETAEFYVTFKVQKTSSTGVKDTIIAGQKSNIAELASYSTLYSDGSCAGKVDKDSAPDNLNIRNFNTNSWYEDDTDSAPVLHLTVLDDTRTVKGTVWEDSAVDGETTGNGIKDDHEAVIGGLTTQLVEKVTVDGIDYDFIWPTNEALNCLGGKSMKDLTGFESTIETSREKVVANEGEENETVEVEVGSYKFTGVPSGNYVVRFYYGNDKTEFDNLTTTDLKDPVALTETGEKYFENENILTANYDGDKEGVTPAVYNGQDYKATIYQAGFNYSADKNYNLEDENLTATRVSDARDSEARRLEIIANSETIMNANASILATANSKSEDHTELYRDYYMFADTAIIKLESGDASAERVIENIDCGLIERPETAIVLDKQISSIKLTTNDQRVIFNADYEITYEETNSPANKTVISKIGDNNYLVAKVTLKENSIGTDVLQALDKVENKLSLDSEENNLYQNFRFINVEDTILQGTTVEINYVMTALNVGEVDYTTDRIENIRKTATENNTSVSQELYKLATEAATANTNGEYGTYVGSYYYTGDATGCKIVTTRVRKVVDYVDNDAVFSPIYNSEDGHMWKTTNVTELGGNGYRAERLLDNTVLSGFELLDKNNVGYISNQGTNAVLSVETQDNELIEAENTMSVQGNSGFEAKLEPYSINPEKYKSQIELTVTRTVSAQDGSADQMSYDNIAEIVKLQNSVGRRDIEAIPGNANPKLGEFKAAKKERDASATELVTFTPPTGTKTENTMTIQVLIVTTIALAIIAVGIVIIKKKVL